MADGCINAIISEEYQDILVSYGYDYEALRRRFEDACINAIDENWAVMSVPVSEYGKISYSVYGYSTIPKLFGLCDKTSMVESGVIRIRNQPGLNLRGRNVLIGFVDTGIDYTHEVFVNQDGTTKIVAIWDQTIQDNTVFSSEGYGTVYYEKDINEALQSANPYDIVPSRDEIGHGTFAAGIAAGREMPDFTGAAPDSGIVMVKLRQAKKYLRDYYFVREDAVCYSEVDIMYAVNFLNRIATQMGMPIVIYIGVGTSFGQHYNGLPVCEMLTRTAERAASVVVTATGNEALARHHFSGYINVGEEYQTVEIDVGQNERGFQLELWGFAPDIFTVSITSPLGESVPRIPARLGNNIELAYIYDRTRVYLEYMPIEVLTGNEVVILRFENPTQGIWRINVYGDNLVNRAYNMWLPMTELLSSDTVFLQPDPDITLLAPSTVKAVISVGAYNHRSNSIYINSGRGYNAIGDVKPDIVAPGVDVYGPVLGRGNNSYGRRTGTSIAAAHVAGAAALLTEWKSDMGERNMVNTAYIKTLLIKGAQRKDNVIYPNKEWGYGSLNVYNTFENIAGT